MWATQLLTMRSSLVRISNDFIGTPNFVGVGRVEMVLFNCEQWGISVRSLTLEMGGSLVGAANPTVTSCDSLVRVCMLVDIINSPQTELILSFIPIGTNDWVHIAEVTFYGAGPTCPPDAILTAITTPIAVTTPEMNATGTIQIVRPPICNVFSRIKTISLYRS